MRSGCMSRRHSRRLSRWPRRDGGPCGGGEGAAAQAARDAAARAARERHEKVVGHSFRRVLGRLLYSRAAETKIDRRAKGG